MRWLLPLSLSRVMAGMAGASLFLPSRDDFLHSPSIIPPFSLSLLSPSLSLSLLLSPRAGEKARPLVSRASRRRRASPPPPRRRRLSSLASLPLLPSSSSSRLRGDGLAAARMTVDRDLSNDLCYNASSRVIACHNAQVAVGRDLSHDLRGGREATRWVMSSKILV